MNRQDIYKQLPFALRDLSLPQQFGDRYSGKVRECYVLPTRERMIIATDRTSVFDFLVGCVPFKGQVLTKLSRYWFDATRDIIQNHLIELLDPNVMLVHECTPLPMELVVRGYITGVTTTSMWFQYSRGVRRFCGHDLPEGLKKNQRLPTPLVTPSTKETRKGVHDQSVSGDELLEATGIKPALYHDAIAAAQALFQRGDEIARSAGFILVDTKYEFGIDKQGRLMLIDEIHTPDSSRFWPQARYETCFARGDEMDNYDKEFIRLFLAERGLTEFGQDEARRSLPDELFVETAARFIFLCESICREPLAYEVGSAEDRIHAAITDRFATPCARL